MAGKQYIAGTKMAKARHKRPAALVLVFAMLSYTLVLHRTTAQQLIDPPRARPLRICTASIGDIVARCDNSTTTLEDKFCTGKADNGFCGYNIDVWRNVADELNLVAGVDYEHVCMGEDGFKLLIKKLTDPGVDSEPFCDIGVSSITRTVSRRDRGIQFSPAIYRGALGVMIRGKVTQGGTWGFLKPLNWTVWLAVAITAMVVPVLVFAFEHMLSSRTVYGALINPSGDAKGSMFGLKEAMWHAFSSLLAIDVFRVNSLPARLVVLAYGFMAVIITATYTANLAAFLTQSQLDADINNTDDLVSRRVATDTLYKERLQTNYHIKAYDVDSWAYKNMTRDLQNKKIDALITDDLLLDSFVSRDKSCTVHLLQDVIDQYDIAFAYRKHFTDTPANAVLVKNISDIIHIYQEDNTLTALLEETKEKKAPERSKCGTDVEFVETTPVTIWNMLGLWYIILGACITALLVAGFIVRARRRSASNFSIDSLKKNQPVGLAASRRMEAGRQHEDNCVVLGPSADLPSASSSVPDSAKDSMSNKFKAEGGKIMAAQPSFRDRFDGVSVPASQVPVYIRDAPVYTPDVTVYTPYLPTNGSRRSSPRS